MCDHTIRVGDRLSSQGSSGVMLCSTRMSFACPGISEKPCVGHTNRKWLPDALVHASMICCCNVESLWTHIIANGRNSGRVPDAKSLVIPIPKLHRTSPLLHLEPPNSAAVFSFHICTIVGILNSQNGTMPFSTWNVNCTHY